jgi:hypothetical protein
VLCDIVTDVGHLLRPAAVVAEKGFAAAGIGNVIEAGLGKPEERAAGSGGLEAEFDEGRDFFGVIDVGIDRVGMPGEGEVLLRVDLLDDGAPGEVFVARPGDHPACFFADGEGRFQVDAEPCAELAVIGEGAPDTGDRRGDLDLLLNAVG